MLDLADCYRIGDHGVQKNEARYFDLLHELLEHIDELRDSKYSSSLIFYELMYQYLDQKNWMMADYCHHCQTWELVWDYTCEDLESYIKDFQIREVAKSLGKDIEKVIDKVKVFQKEYDYKAYKVLSVNHFFTI